MSTCSAQQTLVLARTAALVRFAGRLRCLSPQAGTDTELATAPPDFFRMLALLARAPAGAADRAAWARRLQSGGMATDADDADALVAGLVRVGLLVADDRSRGRADRRSAGADLPFDVAAMLALNRTTSFADYRDPGTWSSDRRRMADYARLEPPPARSLRHAGVRYRDCAAQLAGPLRARTGDDRLPARVARLMRLTFAATDVVPFHDHAVARKPVPSMGARHGLEAYLLTASGRRSRRTLHHYDAASGELGALADLPAGADPGPHPGLRLVVVAHFERYQWRYRHSWVYGCLWLDLGHVLAQLRLLARDLGLRLSSQPDAPGASIGPAPAVWPPLQAEPVLAVDVSEGRSDASR